MKPKPAIKLVPVYHEEYTTQTVEKLARIIQRQMREQKEAEVPPEGERECH